ncbi:MAG: hypothetical protein NVSMB3_13860 [Acidobacteriaceae bacterium]
MLGTHRSRLLILLLCVVLLASSLPARAQTPISSGQAAGIFAVLIGLGVGAGVGVYYLVRTPPSLSGCLASSAAGLQLYSDGDHQAYALSGELSALQAGSRVRLKGKRSKDSAKNRKFLVEKVSKDLGPCTAAPATP